MGFVFVETLQKNERCFFFFGQLFLAVEITTERFSITHLLVGVSVELEKLVLGRNSADELTRFSGLTVDAEAVFSAYHSLSLLVHFHQGNRVKRGENPGREPDATLAESHVH